eukprot:CAMPEP_0183474656 /NCGR_PEP_ID=MMETSP0370-20130417/163452_1 /TAXON_ID=268820 /ORGANISM="Peridinium aciculiferum, Strain PAER-2" /LENGTH=87 /DNA_ID=CAMNT_0025667397 /DNA_START=24 /DNA_END=284 /DNA_ORIENTATION=+
MPVGRRHCVKYSSSLMANGSTRSSQVSSGTITSMAFVAALGTPSCMTRRTWKQPEHLSRNNSMMMLLPKSGQECVDNPKAVRKPVNV